MVGTSKNLIFLVIAVVVGGVILAVLKKRMGLPS